MLVIGGRQVPVPGLESSSFAQDPRLGFTDKDDYSMRETSWVRSVCIHTRMGISKQKIVPAQNRSWDQVVAARASRDDRHASWHISVDADGSFICHLDLLYHKAHHAGQTNEYSIGIEMYQGADGSITEETLKATVLIVDVITRELGIQRFIPAQHETGILRRFGFPKYMPWNKGRKLAYVKGGMEGKDYIGVWGHRNGTKNRGKGDPGDLIWEHFAAAGYRRVVLDSNEDLDIVRITQLQHGITPNDGIAGPITVASLKRLGFKHGQLYWRPCDDQS